MDQSSLNRGDHAIEVIENLTLLGDYAGEPVVLRPWQKDLIRTLLGTIDPTTGLRQYKSLFLFMPRSNSKTILITFLLLYFLLFEGKAGQEIYSTASTQKQAAKIFEYAVGIINADPHLQTLCTIKYDSLTIEGPNGNVYTALCAAERAAHSHKPSVILADEYHLIDQRYMDTLKRGMGTRRERLVIMITTAGTNRQSACYFEYQYARRVRDARKKGEEIDPTYLPILYTAEDYPNLDWGDPKLWALVNPAYGDFIDPTSFADDYAKAKELPTEEAAFKQLLLNMWVQSYTRYMPYDSWQACAARYSANDLHGLACVGGLDLACISDLTGLVLLFEWEGKLRCLAHAWLPEQQIQKHKNRALYLAWQKAGFLTLTPGNAVDYDYIRQHVNDLSNVYDIQKIYVDPLFNAHDVCSKMIGDGLPIEYIRQGFISQSPPAKELLRRVLSNQFEHDDNPIMNWCVQNAIAVQDAAGNIKIDKEKTEEKVDLLCALINAMGAQMAKGVESVEDEARDDAGVSWL